mmetsp:Transcript_11302/g.26874  ORF Transcript_11302/g.26874 Transcript_11302/m.26874 type:complete len:704 (+) Transcript_11302:1-2112(+)
MSSNRDSTSPGDPQGDDIIDLFHQFLVQSPSDFSITILPSTVPVENATTKSSETEPLLSLDYSIVFVDGHLGLDARSLPWITRELRKAYKKLRQDKHVHQYSRDLDDDDNDETKSVGAAAAASKIIKTTECLLLVNPDHSTVWADRRRALLRTLDNSCTQKSNDRQWGVWKNEIQFLDLLFSQHSKAPTSWAHRKYCLRKISNLLKDDNDQTGDEDSYTYVSRAEIFRHEIEICTNIAEKYPKNYYAWTHRLYLWSSFFPKQSSIDKVTNETTIQLKKIVLEEEIDSLWKWLHLHPSDHSAVHNLATVIKFLLESTSTDEMTPDITEKIDQILKNVYDLISEHGEHESVWILRRSVNRIFWEFSLKDRVIADVQSVLQDIKQKRAYLYREAQMIQWYRSTFLAWCCFNFRGDARHKLMSSKDVQLIVELLQNDAAQNQEIWKHTGRQLLDHSRDSVADWQTFQADHIPSKGIKVPPLFYKSLQQRIDEKTKKKTEDSTDQLDQLRILELGCGCGDLCRELQSVYGHRVVGIDVNESAIAQAKRNCPLGEFHVADVTNYFQRGTHTASAGSFDACILQLLLSIVGGPKERKRTLETAFRALSKTGGTLYLSCSGVSDDINENYRRLYQQDSRLIGEEHSYYSREFSSGSILYTTHHFTVSELETLLQAVGFHDIQIEQHKECSSRRPDEAAYFLYATATVKPSE